MTQHQDPLPRLLHMHNLGIFFKILESAKLAIEIFMMELNISPFIYNLDVTYVSFTYKQKIHPKLAFSSNFFTR